MFTSVITARANPLNMLPPLLHAGLTSPQQHATRATSILFMTAALDESSSGGWEMWRIHDYFNLVVLVPIITLVVLALAKSASRPAYLLAVVMSVYMVVDGAWIAFRPDIVRAPTVLLGHHAATLVLLWHLLTFPSHLKYVAWMSLVEANTLLLIAKRHITRCRAALDVAFHGTWLAIRVLWFPYVAIHLWSLPASAWPAGASGLVRRLLVCLTTTALTMLQLVWTRNALKPLIAKWRGEDADGAAKPKSGFL